MAEENELQRLEDFVSTLLQKFNDLQDENKELTERLQRREATIETLQGDLASMKDERGDISTRVSNLIGKIEEWESSIDESDGESASEATDETSKDSGVQGKLFSADA
ncbi:MAG: hypothetical protein K9K37_11075 [Desulfocapsa sp.]|nr:hypothetical protein [Desulfocapsa sp.]